MSNYNKSPQQSETNDPQAAYSQFATSHMVACFLIGTYIQQVERLEGQNKADAYSDCKAAIDMMDMPEKWKDDQMLMLDAANQTDVDRMVQDYWNTPVTVHDQVQDQRVKVVDPLWCQPRVEKSGNITTVPILLEGI